jgi:hypothetical protein
MERNEFYKQTWIDYNEEKICGKKTQNILYNTEVIPWEKNELNYCVICREKLDNSKENIVVFPKYDFIVHKLCIEMYFI